MPDTQQKLLPEEPWQETTRAPSLIPREEPAASGAVLLNVGASNVPREGCRAGAGTPNLERQEHKENGAATLIPHTESTASKAAVLINVRPDDLTRRRRGAEISMPEIQRQLEPRERQHDEGWAASLIPQQSEPASPPLSIGSGGLARSLLQSPDGRIRAWPDARWLPWKKSRNARPGSLARSRPSLIVSPYSRRQHHHRRQKMRTGQQHGQAVVDIDEVLVKQAVRQATAAARKWGPGVVELESIRGLQVAELESASSVEAAVTAGAADWGGVRLDTIDAVDGDSTVVPALWVHWHEHQKQQQDTQASEHQARTTSNLRCSPPGLLERERERFKKTTMLLDSVRHRFDISHCKTHACIAPARGSLERDKDGFRQEYRN